MRNNDVIALIGNPNCGKTTLFNGLTGGNVKTGNWPGVTVEKREGRMKLADRDITVVDLPGIYSFSAHSEDEKIARDYILSSEPSLIINIIDAGNMERNMYLTTQLIEMKVPIILVINMMDIAEKQKIKIDLPMLSREMGVPVIGISAIKKQDIEKVKKGIGNSLSNPEIPTVKIEYPNEIEDVIVRWQEKFEDTAREMIIDSRWIAVKVLENDSLIMQKVLANKSISKDEIIKEQGAIESILGESPDIVCADHRYGLIHGLTLSIVKKQVMMRTVSDKIDKVVLNRILGIPIFLGIMYLIFWITISIGGAFIDFFDIFFGTIFVDGLGTLLVKIGSPGWLTLIFANGIGGGIQTISTFIPIIFMMFFMLSLLEDSGYMARAAFVMDRFMKVLGLPGKSFVPLLVGFGCTVPAIMATRTLENKRDRFLTIFMSPFMSCGARLPVYALFAVAFFPNSSGMIVFSIYLVGIILAILTGLLLKNTLFRGEPSYFIMELPPYHQPRLKHIFLHTWFRLKGFILRAGKVIVIIIVILSILNSLGTNGSIGNEDSQDSILSVIGKSIAPVFKPMGIEKRNWPAVVGIFTGIFAKEAVVGTLNSLYGQINASEAEESDEEGFDFWIGIKEAFLSIPEGLSGIFGGLADPLGVGIVSETDRDAVADEVGVSTSTLGLMKSYFSNNKHQAYAYLLFILLYFPCVAAFGAIIKEGGIFLGTLNALYLTLLAWITATLYYQISWGHSILWIILPVVFLGTIAIAMLLLGKSKFLGYREEE